VQAQARRVAIIKPCCIGDAVMALPAVDSLHAALPDAELHIWTGSHSRPIFENRPHISHVKPIANVPATHDVPGIAWKLRQGRYDLICALDRSRLLDAACRLARVPTLASIRGIGVEGRHEIDLYLAALALLGIPATNTSPTIEFTADQRRVARQLESEIGRVFVVMHPGGAENPGASMHTKRWPADHWIELARWAREQGYAVVFTGSRAERALCRQIADRAGPACIMVTAGRFALLESAAIVQSAAAFVGPDTGLSHLSAAAGTPTVALFGPTNPNRYAPRGTSVHVVSTPLSRQLPDTDLRRPARQDPSVAMDRIRVEDVIAALSRALEPASLAQGQL
jgi:ADP-heptose:LPS heptosyltransferase